MFRMDWNIVDCSVLLRNIALSKLSGRPLVYLEMHGANSQVTRSSIHSHIQDSWI